MEEVHCPLDQDGNNGERMWYEACLFNVQNKILGMSPMVTTETNNLRR